MSRHKYHYDTKELTRWMEELRLQLGERDGLGKPILISDLADRLSYRSPTVVGWRRGSSRPSARSVERLSTLSQGLRCQKSEEEIAAIIGLSTYELQRMGGASNPRSYKPPVRAGLCGDGVPRCPVCQHNYDDDKYTKSSYRDSEMCAGCAWSANQVRLAKVKMRLMLETKKLYGGFMPLCF